jgi:hypothetical protein
MTTSTLTVTDFVWARIAEDEAAAGKVEAPLPVRGYATVTLTATDTIAALCVDPARVLAECAAMRKIVERHARRGGVESWMDADWVADMDDMERAGICAWCTYDDRTVRFPCGDLLDVASIWSDHPQFDPGWE